MPTYATPGVYKEEVFLAPAAELRTGVPAFLGVAREDAEEPVDANRARPLTLWSEFVKHFGAPLPHAYLAYAVRGFFENDGQLCYVVRLDDTVPAVTALRGGLDALAPLDTIDLICAPDIVRPRQPGDLPPDPVEVRAMQAAVLEHCDTLGDRFAILDSLPSADVNKVLEQRRGLNGTNGALYYPWLQVPDGPALTGGYVPPCGHVAGVYARSDQRVGVHKAPANDILKGVLDLEVNLTDAQQGLLNPEGVNGVRAFPGRGIRVWGARTLSGDPVWTYVNVRRLFLTAGRWIERNMSGAVFEPNDTRLWARIGRELTAYFNDLFRRGALKGRTAQEAFYVKCDAETNPPEVRDAGMVVTEIGLAPALPGEFVVVRIIHGAGGISLGTTPASPPTPAPAPSGPVVSSVPSFGMSAAAASTPMRSGVQIAHVEYNPPGMDVPAEYVLVQNTGGAAIDMTGWTLSDRAFHTFVFPSFMLSPGASVRVWTKSGSNTATDLYWGRGAAIWNNRGDTAYLRNSDGLLVAVFPQSQS